MKNTDATYVTVGKIGSTYGVRGWLKIHSYTEISTDILNFSPWYLADTQKQWHALNIEEGKVHGLGIIAKFTGVNTKEDARPFAGKIIAITRSQLPELKKHEYYWSDLEGLTVINKDGIILGKVVYLLATGSNDVLVVKGDSEFGIPYLPGSVIIQVNLAKQEILVDWEGG